MRRRREALGRGAIRLGFIDLLVIAVLTAILLFASFKQFPAYHRPFKPRPILTPAPRALIPKAIRTPAAADASHG